MVLQLSVLVVMHARLRVLAAEKEGDGRRQTTLDVEEGRSGDVIALLFKDEAAVKNDSKVLEVRRWKQGGKSFGWYR